MGFFDNSDNVQPGVAPLNRARVRAVMDNLDLKYTEPEGEEGPIFAPFEKLALLVNITESSEDTTANLSICCEWRGSMPLAYRPQLLELIDQWHRETLLPKVYTRILNLDEGEVLDFRTEVNFFWENGLTDDHIETQIMSAVQTSHGFIDRVEETFGTDFYPEN